MTDQRLRDAERAWRATGSYQDEQAYLSQRLRTGAARHVFLDPDGTFGRWLGVVVRQATGVVYEQQCACVTNDARLVEGFYVPLGGAGFVLVDGIDFVGLTEVFHRGSSCDSSPRIGTNLTVARLERLQSVVGSIACWSTTLPGKQDHRVRLQVDTARLAEVAEAWVPVETPLGPGVLLYQNCD